MGGNPYVVWDLLPAADQSGSHSEEEWRGKNTLRPDTRLISHLAQFGAALLPCRESQTESSHFPQEDLMYGMY